MGVIRIDVRAFCVVSDVRKLVTNYNAFSEGLSYRQLRVLVQWHCGEDREIFNAFRLRDIGLLSNVENRWKPGRQIAAYEVEYCLHRPDLPVDICEALGKEDNLTRRFYDDLAKRGELCEMTLGRRQAGDVILYKMIGGCETVLIAGEPPRDTTKQPGRRRPRVKSH